MFFEIVLNNEIQIFFISTTSLVVKAFISILGDQGSIFMNGMGYGQRWNVDKIFPTYIAKIG
jgi:hypothetical protein